MDGQRVGAVDLGAWSGVLLVDVDTFRLAVTIANARELVLTSSDASILNVSSVLISSTELIFASKSIVVSSIRMNGIGSIVRIGTSSASPGNTAGVAGDEPREGGGRGGLCAARGGRVDRDRWSRGIAGPRSGDGDRGNGAAGAQGGGQRQTAAAATAGCLHRRCGGVAGARSCDADPTHLRGHRGRVRSDLFGVLERDVDRIPGLGLGGICHVAGPKADRLDEVHRTHRRLRLGIYHSDQWSAQHRLKVYGRESRAGSVMSIAPPETKPIHRV